MASQSALQSTDQGTSLTTAHRHFTPLQKNGGRGCFQAMNRLSSLKRQARIQKIDALYKRSERSVINSELFNFWRD